MRKFVSNSTDLGKVDTHKMNLITAGCGSGKSYFCARNLTDYYKDVSPNDIVFVTSRALAVEQQARMYNLIKFEFDDDITEYWAGRSEAPSVDGIRIMTLNNFTYVLRSKTMLTCNPHAFDRAKIIVFDEVHAIYTDTFIDYISIIPFYISYRLLIGDCSIIGMTATPEIVYASAQVSGLEINLLNDPVEGYKAKQLWCVDKNQIPGIIKKFKGKTIVLCKSIGECESLRNSLDGLRSGILVSASEHKDSGYIPCLMDDIRLSIINESKIPDNLDVLFATTTLREGITLNANSGIRNVICCFSDDMHIHQFAGRCRFNIDNLVVAVADNYYYNDNTKSLLSAFYKKHADMYIDFCKNQSHHDWFDLIADIIDHTPDQTIVTATNKPQRVKKMHTGDRPANPNLCFYKSMDSEEKLRDFVDKRLDNNKLGIRVVGQEMRDKILSDLREEGVLVDIVKWKDFQNILNNLGYDVIDKSSHGKRYKIIVQHKRKYIKKVGD